MTNTRITDAEIFERRYPVILREFSLRAGSGGKGLHRGGDGVIRDIEFRIPVEVSILSERRVYHPYGLHGGGDAACGINYWVRQVEHRSDLTGSAFASTSTSTSASASAFASQSESRPVASSEFPSGPESESGSEAKKRSRRVVERYINLGAKNTASMKPGERIVICTPGGGGWGSVSSSSSMTDGATGGGEGGGEGERDLPQISDPRHWWRGGGSLLGRTQMQETN